MTQKRFFYLTIFFSILIVLSLIISGQNLGLSFISFIFIWIFYVVGSSFMKNNSNKLNEKDEGPLDNTEENMANMKRKMYSGVIMKHLREKENLSRKKLGQLMGGYSEDYITQMEDGDIHIDENTIIRLSRIFNISSDRFKME